MTDEGVHLASGSEDLNGRYRLALTDDGLAVHQVCSTGLQGLERAQTIGSSVADRALMLIRAAVAKAMNLRLMECGGQLTVAA